jgi:hypothetical protein
LRSVFVLVGFSGQVNIKNGTKRDQCRLAKCRGKLLLRLLSVQRITLGAIARCHTAPSHFGNRQARQSIEHHSAETDKRLGLFADRCDHAAGVAALLCRKKWDCYIRSIHLNAAKLAASY